MFTCVGCLGNNYKLSIEIFCISLSLFLFLSLSLYIYISFTLSLTLHIDHVLNVTDHSISGLAKLSKSVQNNVGVEDKQLESIAVDDEYVKKSIKEKLLENIDIPEMTDKEKDDWITMACSK